MKNVSIDDINKWLSTNEVYVMITRFPVPHQGGAIMSRVKFLHKREAVIMMEINDVKGRLEGDNDGDHVQVEFLPDAIEKDYLEHLNGLKIKTLNLSNFINPKNDSKIEISIEGRAKLIASLTAGEFAIAELANLQGQYGTIVQIFDNIYVGTDKNDYSRIRIKSMDEIIELPFYHSVNGIKKPWKGTIAEYLRLMLQAAADNGKYGLLGEWNYDIDSVRSNLIEVNPAIKGEDLTKVLKSVKSFFRLHKAPLDIRQGRDRKDGRYGIKEGIEHSSNYLAYVEDRIGYITDNENMSVDMKDLPEGYMSPLEMVGIAMAKANREQDLIYSKANKDLLFRDGSPYIISIGLHQRAHVIAMEAMDKSLSDRRLESKTTLETNQDELDEIAKGTQYAIDMGTEMQILIEDNRGEMTAQSMDYNISFMAFQEKWHEVFNSLSDTAKLSATDTFLKGEWKNKISVYNPTTQQSEMREVEGGAIGLYLPPVSDQSNQPSLLEHSFVKEYFKNFNKVVSEAREDTYKKKHYKALYRIAKEKC